MNRYLSAEPEGASISITCEEEFDTWSEDGDKIPFGLTLFEVEMACKRLSARAGS